MRQVGAQVEITQQFGPQAANLWGKYANEKFLEAVNAGDEEAAKCWAPDGACRAAGHVLLAGAGGGLPAALGAGTASLVMPHVYGFFLSQGIPTEAAQALSQLVALGLGAGMGGEAGAYGAFNEAGNNAVVAVPLLVDMIAAAGVAAARACMASPACVNALRLGGVASLAKLAQMAAAGDDPQGQDGAAGDKGNAVLPDTYGTPPNGASPPPGEGDDDDGVSNASDVRRLVREASEPYGTSGRAFNVNSEQELRDLFAKVTNNSTLAEDAGTYGGTMRILPDGTRVGFRASSRTGGAR